MYIKKQKNVWLQAIFNGKPNFRSIFFMSTNKRKNVIAKFYALHFWLYQGIKFT